MSSNKEVPAERPLPTLFYSHSTTLPDEPPDHEVDIMSVDTIGEDIFSTAESSSTSPTFRQAAVDYLVTTFTDDEELLGLYQEATRCMDEPRFIRNHRRLLKLYFLDLHSRLEEQTPSQKLAVGLLRRRHNRILISSEICRLVTPLDMSIREKKELQLQQKRDALFLLDRFLSQRDSESAHGMDNTDAVSEASEDSDDEADLEGDQIFSLRKLEDTAGFLTAGRPFQLYKENLRTFLQPKLEPLAPNETIQALNTRMDCAFPGQPPSNVENADLDAVVATTPGEPIDRISDRVQLRDHFPASAKRRCIFYLSRWRSWVGRIMRPKLTVGYRRIEWTCVSKSFAGSVLSSSRS
jgi:hypothetical protein